MKFGRAYKAAIAAETAEPALRAGFLDYKALKKAAGGGAFDALLTAELDRVNAFFASRQAELEAAMAGLAGGALAAASTPHHPPPAGLASSLRARAAALQRFAGLNYVAVVKITKKDLKKRAAAAAAAAPCLDRLSLEDGRPAPSATPAPAAARAAALARLAAQPFFSSPDLAALMTRARLLSDDDGGGDGGDPHGALRCPVCLDLFASPVVLACAHAFCWSCTAAVVGTAAARAAGEHEKTACCKGGTATAARPPASPARLFFFDCPVCRRPHASTFFDAIGVDAGLAAAVDAAKAGSAAATVALPPPPPPPGPPPLLPPPPSPPPALTVVLDLDGTLIASFPPSRAGELLGGRRGGAAAFVAPGGSLNKDGVLVVERPGLGEFLGGLAALPGVEVIAFTAGLPDYAHPIMECLASRHTGAFPAPPLRLTRGATSPGASYPCIKDLGRLGRDLGRTVILEDTALAFLAHPDNGIPVVPFRGDGDDRILVEAVLPLIAGLAADARGATEGARAAGSASSAPFDVRPVLAARFRMRAWFEGQGVVCGPAALAPAAGAGGEDEALAAASTDEEEDDDEGECGAPPAALPASSAASAAVEEEGDDAAAASALVAAAVADGLFSAAGPPRAARPALAVFDFDHSLLADADVGEEVVAQLAPELVPLLQSLQMPANFIPLTNAVLAEAARRGVGGGAWSAAAAAVGARGLAGRGAAATLRTLAAASVPSVILSDANDLFIHSALAGAGLGPGTPGHPARVITNTARFVEAGRLLRVHPRHPPSAAPHGCPLCPENLCKGMELGRLRKEVGGAAHGGLLYTGDGENDLCPATRLVAGDVLLVRLGRGLERTLRERAGGKAAAAAAAGAPPPDAHAVLEAAAAPALAAGLAPGVRVFGWERADELAALVAALVGGGVK